MLAGSGTTSTEPLVYLVRALDATKDGTLNERFFLDLLGRGFIEDAARAQLDAAIDWGRYGELFDYDANDGVLVRTTADGNEHRSR